MVIRALEPKLPALLLLVLPAQWLLTRNWPRLIRRLAGLCHYYVHHYCARSDSSVVGELRDHPIVGLPFEH